MGPRGALTLDEVAAVAAASSAAETYAIVEALAQRALGHRLFTLMLFHEATEEVERVYSTRPDVYPVGGRKPKRGNPWGAIVLERGEVYLGRTADDIRWAFDDHPLILALGLESVMNVPVAFRGRPLGTMNLLHEADRYGPEDVPVGRLLAGLLVPELLAARAAPGG
jgi:GAF domain-containing protein